MRLFRVFPYDPNAAEHEPGGALFRPRSSAGRIDNPDLYSVLYLSDHAEAAIAECLGRLAVWRPTSFIQRRDAVAYRLALATYELPDAAPIADLRNLDLLQSLGVMLATDVITRNRAHTQQLARAIFTTNIHIGISWWSYYDPDWGNLGIWESKHIRLSSTPELLDERHPAVVRAAAALPRYRVLGRRENRSTSS